MSHANARLSEYGRNLIAERVLAGHKPGEVAKQAGVSRQTVYKWVRRFQAEGRAGMTDRSSRPHTSPTRTSVKVTARITAARRSTTAAGRQACESRFAHDRTQATFSTSWLCHPSQARTTNRYLSFTRARRSASIGPRWPSPPSPGTSPASPWNSTPAGRAGLHPTPAAPGRH